VNKFSELYFKKPNKRIPNSMIIKFCKFSALFVSAVLISLSVTVEIHAQIEIEPVEIEKVTVPEPDTVTYWDLNWTASLSGAQAAYSNWAKGGVNSMSLTSSSLIQLIYDRGPFIYEFRVRTRYGQARIQDRGVRKTDDLISIRHRFLFDISPEEDDDFRLFGNINFDTQFAEGFNYEAGPEGQDILISDFLSPAYFTQNAGIAYFPQANFSIEAGLGLRQTIVRDTTLSTRYGLEAGQTFKNQGGVTVGINFEFGMMDNISYSGSLETFTNILRPIRRTNVFFSNELVGRVNNVVRVVFRLDMNYDDDFSRRLQFRQELSAGVTINIR
jgi:hypothetical protein